MGAVQEILANQVLMSAAAGWFTAQVLKTMIDTWSTGSFKFERLYGNGGMPSSHSATVCALATSAAHAYGLSSFEFAVSFILGMVVMIDAMGVRRETGKQSQLLNHMMQSDFWKVNNPEEVEIRLKEFIGHTPLQVLVGGILGIIIASVMNVAMYS